MLAHCPLTYILPAVAAVLATPDPAITERAAVDVRASPYSAIVS